MAACITHYLKKPIFSRPDKSAVSYSNKGGREGEGRGGCDVDEVVKDERLGKVMTGGMQIVQKHIWVEVGFFKCILAWRLRKDRGMRHCRTACNVNRRQSIRGGFQIQRGCKQASDCKQLVHIDIFACIIV